MNRPVLTAAAALSSLIIMAGAVEFGLSVGTAPPAPGSGPVSAATRLAATTSTASPSSTASTPAAAPSPADTLLDPHGTYVGLATPGSVSAWTTATGTRPDMLEEFIGWGQPLPAVAANWSSGELTLVSLQSNTTTLASIASGQDDLYLDRIAVQARTAAIPIALDFDHEFNGNWYPWGADGSQHASPAEFVAAWRHMHDVFEAAGARNVIWVWSPNVVNPLPKVALAPYWPGTAYVTWAGMVGYWTGYEGQGTYTTLYGPTERQIEALTDDPILITETGAEQGSEKAAWITALLNGVRTDSHVIGFVYFDYGAAQGKREDWTIEDDEAAVTAWRTAARSLHLPSVG
ncbi:hypothetical protein KDK95_07995 [Actinospica sp. MGRD01-02]|uniref:GH26 domain-containing protein n=1 Tax=Actinospica acidithermotolerans TaxID=2828514 RepID=A0A941E933_9ACTN|nr:glycosyl hydrolase [Actinospica acidithermotolerans]MBR7826238.1 hypothetical protein [Actinospica acidithermotolerans]